MLSRRLSVKNVISSIFLCDNRHTSEEAASYDILTEALGAYDHGVFEYKGEDDWVFGVFKNGTKKSQLVRFTMTRGTAHLTSQRPPSDPYGRALESSR